MIKQKCVQLTSEETKHNQEWNKNHCSTLKINKRVYHKLLQKQYAAGKSQTLEEKFQEARKESILYSEKQESTLVA